jgi:DNA-binding NarL/FixJ family response regulator
MAQANEAVEIARRTGDPDLLVMALNVLGRSLLRMGDTSGMAPLDEAMVTVVADAVSPIPAGTVYCSVIEACEEIADFRRAQEWTEALDAWCTRQGDMVTFTGRCLIHRSSVLLRKGEWAAAITEARRACDRLVGASDEVSSGRAHYQLGELARMRGDEKAAETEFREAARWGHDPQPGLALLRLAQGDTAAATAMMRRLDAEHAAYHERAGFLPAFVRIMTESDDPEAARRAAIELERIASTLGTDCLRAEADRAAGVVALASGDPAAALTALRRASTTWRSLGAPFEVAQTQLLIARTCRDLGDAETADLERETAQRTLNSLGVATPTQSLVGSEVLTQRELEVIRLLAAGITNHEIADRLFVSVRTVDRHVANILTKLDVPNRTAAAAYAYEHDLI